MIASSCSTDQSGVGLEGLLRRKGKSSGRARFFSRQRRWRGSTLVRSYGERYVPLVNSFGSLLTLPNGQLLEAMVERPPPPRLVDEFAAEGVAPPESTSPVSEESKKPPPRPYIRRTRSSSSTLSVDSQSSGGGTSPVIEKTQSLPGSATASPISPSVSRPPSLGRRASAGSILETEEPTS